MERKDLLQANGQIFKTQGVALNEKALGKLKLLLLAILQYECLYSNDVCARPFKGQLFRNDASRSQ